MPTCHIEKKHSDDQRKAALALNICTVSVSQIVDYEDINIMKQEYDSILNNLNLQHIIKDEPLLDSLKWVLRNSLTRLFLTIYTSFIFEKSSRL